MNNVKRSIGWADYTWNPVTGCQRGCYYCYARKIHERFHSCPFGEIKFWDYRLEEPLILKKPSKIFVGSNTDIEFWTMGQKIKVFDICYRCQRHTFMFLSKSSNALNYSNYRKLYPNTMQGITIEYPSYRSTIVSQAERYPRPFISFEPLLGGLMEDDIPSEIELVIVGAMTGMRKKNILPQKDWIQSIRDHVPAEKIYWKKNILKFL